MNDIVVPHFHAIPHVVFAFVSFILAVHGSIQNQCTIVTDDDNVFSINCRGWTNHYQQGVLIHGIFAMVTFVGLYRFYGQGCTPYIYIALNVLIVTSTLLLHIILLYSGDNWMFTSMVFGSIYLTWILQIRYPYIEVAWLTFTMISMSSAWAYLDSSAIFIVSHVYFLGFLGFYGGKTNQQHVWKHIAFYLVHLVNYSFCFLAVGRTPFLSEWMILGLNAIIFTAGFLVHYLNMTDSHGIEFFSNVAQLWSYRFLLPVWSHWSSNVLLVTSVGNLALLTVGKMNTMDIDKVNVVDDFYGLHSQVYLRSLVAIPMILAFRYENVFLPWISILLLGVAFLLPFSKRATDEMRHIYQVEQHVD